MSGYAISNTNCITISDFNLICLTALTDSNNNIIGCSVCKPGKLLDSNNTCVNCSDIVTDC